MLAAHELPARDSDSRLITAVVEAPRGTRNKWKYDPKSGLFRLGKVLPAGAAFPFDFGFIPSTIGDDGDPLDMLILSSTPAITGGVVSVRLLGVIQAEQTAREKTVRNDRFLGLIETPYNKPSQRDLGDLDESLLSELEHFFVSYNEAEGRTFKPLGRLGATDADRMVGEGEKRYRDAQGVKAKAK